MPRGYTIAPDRKSITCHRCGLTSRNLNDVRHCYCGRCKIFHDDDKMIRSRLIAAGTALARFNVSLDAVLRTFAQAMAPAIKRISDDIDAFVKSAGKR